MKVKRCDVDEWAVSRSRGIFRGAPRSMGRLSWCIPEGTMDRRFPRIRSKHYL